MCVCVCVCYRCSNIIVEHFAMTNSIITNSHFCMPWCSCVMTRLRSDAARTAWSLPPGSITWGWLLHTIAACGIATDWCLATIRQHLRTHVATLACKMQCNDNSKHTATHPQRNPVLTAKQMQACMQRMCKGMWQRSASIACKEECKQTSQELLRVFALQHASACTRNPHLLRWITGCDHRLVDDCLLSAARHALPSELRLQS